MTTYKEQLLKWIEVEVDKGLRDIRLYRNCEATLSRLSIEDEEQIYKEILEAINAPSINKDI